MKLIEYFAAFLENEVNLDEPRLARLNTSVEAISRYLESSVVFADNFIDTIPQGSYAHKTIIKPVRSGDEFDADLLLYLAEFEDWEPRDYVQKLYECFQASSVYIDKAHRQKRCVTIDYAGDFHVDVVPYLDRSGLKWITHRTENRFELTNPEGYNAWLEEKNRIANRNLVRVIRLLKYLRDYKGTFDIKSFVLNVLVGERINDLAQQIEPGCYADVPTTLRSVMSALHTYLEPRTILPSIIDPSGSGENLSDRWNQDGYAAFRNAFLRYAEWIEDAWLEPQVAVSVQKWQRVFGDKFVAPTKQALTELVRTGSNLPVPYRNTEQFLPESFGIPFAVNTRYRFRITGRVSKQNSFGAYYLKDRGNKVLRGRTIRFEVAECGVPEPFQIFWKIKNCGPEAKQRDCVRGQIEAGGRVWRISETTDFVGPHYVEAFVVKDGVCVARDRQDVVII